MGKYGALKQTAGGPNWDVDLNAAFDDLDADFAAINAALVGQAGTSETSLAVATGSKAFTIDQAGFSATAGATFRATSIAAPTAIMQGTVTSLTGGVLTLNVTATGGSGTHADWSIQAVLSVTGSSTQVSVSSATTCPVFAANSGKVLITGTTAVTAFDSGLLGAEVECEAAGAFTLTSGASILIPGSKDIPTAAGDVFVIRSNGSSIVRVVSYTKADGTPIITPPTLPVTARTANTLIVAGDKGKSFKITSGSFTQTWDSGANLTANFSCFYENAGTGIVTTATDGTTWPLYPGEARLFYSDGSNVKSICIRAGTLTDTTSGNFIVPPGWVGWEQDLLGAGGGGGGGIAAATGGGVFHYGGAGGGGASRRIRRIVIADTSLTPGTSVAYTIGAAGTAGAGGSSPVNGGDGGNTVFNGETAYGGGGGPKGQAAGNFAPGAGAGVKSAATGTTAGAPAATAGAIGIAGQGTSVSSGGSTSAEWGGATGGSTDGIAGGSSIYGGAGGGSGGAFNSSDTAQVATAGGSQGTMTVGAGAAAGSGTAGNPGASGSYGANDLGQGGGGGAPASGSTTAGAGGTGSPGCGGGGGGAQVGTGTAGNGGLGGSGKIVIKGF